MLSVIWPKSALLSGSSILSTSLLDEKSPLAVGWLMLRCSTTTSSCRTPHWSLHEHFIFARLPKLTAIDIQYVWLTGNVVRTKEYSKFHTRRQDILSQSVAFRSNSGFPSNDIFLQSCVKRIRVKIMGYSFPRRRTTRVIREDAPVDFFRWIYVLIIYKVS
ncbi:hypothetical protein EV421DRAFT_205796 [Armillaria borealis]|uniref:Uncharacterized protein n=1 Tax=Armillaria borealis TaxID=47425 RepID=A0AA39IWM5_9AGAR|nr:hypothetical protein EV421DRAFT_205796 [Armillaria borealis]